MSEKKIECIINGQKVKVNEGSSIISAFMQVKKDIAHYCWHPGLSVAGACRLCMVEIKGNPKLQIACNTKVQKDMEISNQSEKVKNAVRWGLEYHLINHPLDCPICDQSGECALQNQYMKFGAYKPSMAESKVKKRKVVDLGRKIVLDTERCILCSRCIRFTNEVTKTNELGIFNRGDRSEIGVFKDKPLDNDYSLNTVDICPVGALTSKDFRFQQRVWYLKTAPSVCNGCSTGCNIYVDYNEEAVWRIRPRYNEKINGHWICDKGRYLYKNTNKAKRLSMALQGEGESWKNLKSKSALHLIAEGIKKESPSFLLTGQYTLEEYKALAEYFPKSHFYHWINNEETFDDFDKLLLRGDRNPNTKGLKKVFPKIKSFSSLKKEIENIKLLFVLGPENSHFFPDIEEKTKVFEKCEQVVWMSLGRNSFLTPKKNFFQIPMKSFVEKEGSYINHEGLVQKIKRLQNFCFQALSVEDCIHFFKEKELDLKKDYPYFKHNQFLNKERQVW